MVQRQVIKAFGYYLWFLLLPLAIPTAIAIYFDWIAPSPLDPSPHSAVAFLVTMGIIALLGLLCWATAPRQRNLITRREGLILVIVVYFLTPLLSGLPFYLNGTFDHLIDAYFESVSAYTTTGSTIIQPKQYDEQTGAEIPYEYSFTTGEKTTYRYFGNVAPVRNAEGEIIRSGVEAVAPSLLFWRSFMQYLGGGGIIVLFVAILPALGVGGKILVQTEVTGPSKESLFPRIKETASLLWKVYLSLAILQTFLLMMTNPAVPLFDAIIISFSTLSTGGFTPKNEGIAAYHSLVTSDVVLVFMILGSINFTLYFFLLQGKLARWNDPELKAFLAIVVITSLFAGFVLAGKPEQPLIASGESSPYRFWTALQVGAFQVISAQTSTGFATANFDLWPFSIQALMLILFYVGGMAGSTAGGLKVVRELVAFKILFNRIERIFRPDTVREYRLGETIIDQNTGMNIFVFLMIAGVMTLLGTFLLILDGVDPETSLSTTGCMLNNIGLAFRMGGPTYSFAFLSNFGKIISCIMMIAGRLEYFALFVILLPAFWRRA